MNDEAVHLVFLGVQQDCVAAPARVINGVRAGDQGRRCGYDRADGGSGYDP